MSAPGRPRRLFTAEEANKTLPLVRLIVADVVEQIRCVQDLQQRLAATAKPRPATKSQADPDDPYAEEVAGALAELEAEKAKLSIYVDELTKLGVELKGADGLCDFPSIHEGREVCLCWKLGEDKVAHWHEPHEGFAGRRPLGPDGTPGPDPARRHRAVIV